MSTSYAESQQQQQQAPTRTDLPGDDQNLPSVRSRINWGPVFAGAVVALASYFVLTMLGAAVGVTLMVQTDTTQVSNWTLSIGGAIYAVVATAGSLFIGAWVCTQLSIGETPRESVVNGVVVWGTVMGLLMMLAAAGVAGGLAGLANTATGREMASSDSATRGKERSWEDLAQNAGVPADRIEAASKAIPEERRAASAKAAAPSESDRQAAANRVTSAAWWTLAATVLSMAAAVCGAIAGTGQGNCSLARDLRTPVRHPASPM